MRSTWGTEDQRPDLRGQVGARQIDTETNRHLV
jgi:hypothetical protein